MRYLARGALALVGLLALALGALFGGVGPLAALPGGVLWGERRPPPDDWSFTDAVREVQLQTHVGPLPWSVTTWVLSSEGELFIGASECDRVWTRRVQADPEIRLRVQGVVYELQARPETDRSVAARLAPVVLQKYLGIAAESANWVPGGPGCMFRILPR